MFGKPRLVRPYGSGGGSGFFPGEPNPSAPGGLNLPGSKPPRTETERPRLDQDRPDWNGQPRPERPVGVPSWGGGQMPRPMPMPGQMSQPWQDFRTQLNGWLATRPNDPGGMQAWLQSRPQFGWQGVGAPMTNGWQVRPDWRGGRREVDGPVQGDGLVPEYRVPSSVVKGWGVG